MHPLPTGRALLDPAAILSQAGLSAGERYADFGAGSLGHFVLPASAIVGPDGQVFALDVLPQALASLKNRAAAEAANNLVPVWGDFEHPNGVRELPQHGIDLVSFMNVSGALLRSPQAIANAVRVLKPGGRLLLVDWNQEASTFGPPPARRHAPEELRALLEPRGFHLVKSFAAGPHHWGLMFTK